MWHGFLGSQDESADHEHFRTERFHPLTWAHVCELLSKLFVYCHLDDFAVCGEWLVVFTQRRTSRSETFWYTCGAALGLKRARLVSWEPP